MRGLISGLLGWPAAWGVGGNLVADAIVWLPAQLVIAWRHRRALHRRLDELESALKVKKYPSDRGENRDGPP